MRLKWYVVLITAVLVTTSVNAAAAQQRQQFFIYSVKFLCGLQIQAPSSPPREPPVKPGNYATAVNIHNFHLAFNVPFCKKAVIANPQSAKSASSAQKNCFQTKRLRWTAATS